LKKAICKAPEKAEHITHIIFKLNDITLHGGSPMPLRQRFKISPTSRGAIFKLKRWFYLNFFSKASAEVREQNKQAWLELSRKLIDELNKRGASDKPARITLEYEKGINNEFIPVAATIELMEIKPLEVITVELRKVEGAKT